MHPELSDEDLKNILAGVEKVAKYYGKIFPPNPKPSNSLYLANSL
jgi:hypothetical protein